MQVSLPRPIAKPDRWRLPPPLEPAIWTMVAAKKSTVAFTTAQKADALHVSS
jgi:hypothetical protein